MNGAIHERIEEVIAELQQIDVDRASIGELRRYFPLVIELNQLRDRQFDQVFQGHERLMRLFEEGKMQGLKIDLADLDKIPLTDRMAVEFIVKQGLRKQFEAYLNQEVSNALRDAGKPKLKVIH